MKLKPRPYQQEALDAVNAALRDRDDNPAIVLPTGAGKSLVMALLIHQWLDACPHFRIMVLAHRKELVEQNAAELAGVDSSLSIGVFAASLKRRDTRRQTTFASIDSVAKRADEFPVQNVLLIDEAHRIPVRREGKYRSFIDAMRARNPHLRIVGLTATPYRMGTGAICHADHILNHVCYEANVGDLIRDGYLSNIRTIEGESSALDLKGVKKIAGEFNLKDLALRVDRDEVVQQAVKDMTAKVRAEGRKSVIVFCIDIDHCDHVARDLRRFGVQAGVVTGKTPNHERERLVEEFKTGRIQYLLSVNVFFEGFNVKRVDCVAMLRPTQSKGLWVQAIGRGLRLHPGKSECLVLDYGDNISRHGPIDIDDGDDVKLAKCGNCENVFSRAVKACPACGTEIPPAQREAFEAEEKRERTLHDGKAQSGMILAKPRWLDVIGVTLRLHRKAGKPDSVRVEYFCGLTIIKEWLLLDHGTYGSARAHKWLSDRGLPRYESSAEMLADCSGQMVADVVKKILVRYEGKYLRVSASDIITQGGHQKII
jgi:DNA repair protein RadD